MLNNCSDGKGRHVLPFGGQCVYIKVGSMAEGKPYKDQQDPAYPTYLEDQMEKACARSAVDSQTLASLTARMDSLEVASR